MKFYNLRKILNYIAYLKRTRADGISIFTSLKRMIIFFILYLLITGVVALIVIFSVNSNIKIVTVPKVVNMDFYKAYIELHNIGLNVKVELKYFDNIPEGKVAYQSINPLKKVKEKRTINLIVSLGPKEYKKGRKEVETNMRSFVINFKLPDNYSKAKVKIIIEDEKNKSRTVFEDIVSPTNLIKIPVKLYGTAKEKILIDDKLFIEKEIE